MILNFYFRSLLLIYLFYIDVIFVSRSSLINYLDESEKTLNSFWKNHYVRLNQCLDLRNLDRRFKNVSNINANISLSKCLRVWSNIRFISLQIRINLIEISDKLNSINDENCSTIDDYENCIKALKSLTEIAQVRAYNFLSFLFFLSYNFYISLNL